VAEPAMTPTYGVETQAEVPGVLTLVIPPTALTRRTSRLSGQTSKESAATEVVDRQLTDEELDSVRGGNDGAVHANAAHQSFAHSWNNGGSATAYQNAGRSKKRN